MGQPEQSNKEPEREKRYVEDADDILVRKARQKLVDEWANPEARKTKASLYLGGTSLIHADATYYSQIAHALFLDGRHQEALQHIDAALKLNPNEPQAYQVRSVVNWFVGKNKEAAADATKLIEVTVDPRHKMPLTQQQEKDFAYLEKRNNHADGYFLRGRAFRSQARFSDAIAEYEHAIQVMPRFRHVLEELRDIFANCPDSKVRNRSRAAQLQSMLDELHAERRR